MSKQAITLAAMLVITVLPLRAQTIDVTHYKAEVAFNLIQEILSGKVEISVRNPGSEALSAIPLHLVNLNILEAEAGGESVTWSHDDPALTVQLASPLAPGDSIVLELRYSGHAVGEPGVTSWGGCFWNLFGVTFSMGVGFYADYVSMLRHWMPSNDIPSDKATFDVTFTVPDTLVVASAGALASVDRKNGLASFRWVETHPTATYLFNYAVSDYVRINDTWQGIPMEFYVRRADSAKGSTFFDTVSDMMEAFTTRFGPYPFDKVGYCLTPIGAMEHQTMISYPQSSFNQYSYAGSTAAHELAHQWWGDWVTPMDFREAWLSEGFAVYAEMVYQEFIGGRTAYVGAVYETGRNYRSTVAPSEGVFQLYDFPREAPSSNYPQTIYEKGGAVLAMLREVMGEERFFDGMRSYGQLYGYGNATTGDFRAVMEQQHGESLEWFFDQWVYEKGWPDYTFEIVKDEQNPLRIRVLQNQDQSEYPLFQMPISCFAVTRTLDTIRFVLMNNALESQEFTMSGLRSDSVLFVRFDPDRLILSRQNVRTVGIGKLPPAEGFQISPTFPNPLRRGSAAHIPVTVGEPQNISLAIYDSAGKTIATVAGHEYTPGSHSIAIPTDSLHAGHYWVHLRSAKCTHVMSIVVE